MPWQFFAFLDFVVIVTFWIETGYEIDEYGSNISSSTNRVLKALRNLRLFRLVRILEVHPPWRACLAGEGLTRLI